MKRKKGGQEEERRRKSKDIVELELGFGEVKQELRGLPRRNVAMANVVLVVVYTAC